MSKAFVFTLILAISASLSSCSAYRSSGRKSFESKVSQNQSGTSATATSENVFDDVLSKNVCWNQPSNDPLWHLEENSSMTVTKINEDEIQVCAIQL